MVEFLLIPAYWKEEVVLPADILEKLSSYKSIAIFGAVQFIRLEKVIEQLKEKGIKTIVSTDADFDKVPSIKRLKF